jgi:hypothetical protein
MIDIAVAASSAFRFELWTDPGEHENWCNDIAAPNVCAEQRSATFGHLTPLQNILGIRNAEGNWNLSTLELEQN